MKTLSPQSQRCCPSKTENYKLFWLHIHSRHTGFQRAPKVIRSSQSQRPGTTVEHCPWQPRLELF